jgi:hypothetical protein
MYLLLDGLNIRLNSVGRLEAYGLGMERGHVDKRKAAQGFRVHQQDPWPKYMLKVR